MTKTKKNRFGTVGGTSVLAAALFYASATYGQSLGDVARQERERQKQEPRAAHVYTNEDLRREQILLPEDRERVLAARRNESAPEIQAQAVDALELGLPDAGVTLPTPEIAQMPISTELQAPSMIPWPRFGKILAKTTHVVIPTAPVISALPAPELPVVSAKLASPTFEGNLSHAGTKATSATASVVNAPAMPLGAAPDLPVASAELAGPAFEQIHYAGIQGAQTTTDAGNAPVVVARTWAPALPVASAELAGPAFAQTDFAAIQEARTTIDAGNAPVIAAKTLAPALPVASAELAAPTVEQILHQGVERSTTPVRALNAPAIPQTGAPALPGSSAKLILVPPRTDAAVSSSHRSDAGYQGSQRNESLALVSFDRTSTRTAASLDSANAVLAQPVSREIVRHRDVKSAVKTIRFDNGTLPASLLRKKQVAAESATTVRVEHGDSLWKLAKEHLGSGLRWRELAEMNPEITDPGFIRVGDTIRLPNA